MTQTSVLPPPRREPAELTQADDYTIRQAAEMTGLSEHTLRYYERARLLGSVRRERSSRHRRYSAEDIARLRTLACLRAAGMPLGRMRRYFELAKRGVAAAPQQEALLLEQRDVLQARVGELESHLRYIDDKIAYWQAIAAGDAARADDLVQHMSRHLRRTS